MKTTKLLDCALIWVCAVNRSNTVYNIQVCLCMRMNFTEAYFGLILFTLNLEPL